MKTQKFYELFTCLVALLFFSINVAAQNSSDLINNENNDFDVQKFEQFLNEYSPHALSAVWEKLNEHGNNQLDKGELSSAGNSFAKANLVAQKLEDNFLVAKSLHELGRVNRARGDAKKRESFMRRLKGCYV